MALVVDPSLPIAAARPAVGATSTVVLQPGTVVDAEVTKVAENLVQIAIAGLTIDVLFEIPLSLGQKLQLAVSQPQGDGTVRLAIVGQGSENWGDTASIAPDAGLNVGTTAATATMSTGVKSPSPNDPLTPLERIAVSVASENAATQQKGLGPLFANLNVVAVSNELPSALRQSVVQLLAQQTSLDASLTGSDIKTAFQKSGLFLETSLASGAISPGDGVPDLKAALIVLRQTLAEAVKTTESPTADAPTAAAAHDARLVQLVRAAVAPPLAPSRPGDVTRQDALLPGERPQLPEVPSATNADKLVMAEALLNAGARSVKEVTELNLLQEIPRALIAKNISNPNATTANFGSPDGQSEGLVAHTNTLPPPIRGAPPSAQPVAAATVHSDVPLASAVRHLLDDTHAALARQTLLQVASLPDRADLSASDPEVSVPRWNFEIPFATPQGTAIAQFEISRDGGGSDVDPAKRVWRARFSLDVEPAGPVHALISFSDSRTSVRMWAERPQTAARLRANASELGQALSRAALVPGDIVIREGMPPQTRPARAGHFLDRAL
jgi:flagellar hook-length control protein FliK